ncbi:MAG: hypothetical protein U9P42_07720, partial [Candidatus Fermentibacteria bacterium]|nr:hypothetical protein [Candidatus Fermentibacteria bacterium]
METSIALPKLTRKIFAYVKIVSIVVAILIVLIISKTSPSGEALSELESSLGIGSRVLSLVFRGLIVLLINAVLVRLVRTLWFHFEKVPENTAVIRSGDLFMYKTESIAGIPRL